jgi:hypothetical protein
MNRRVKRFLPDVNQPVRFLWVRFAMVWFVGWVGLQLDHVQGEFTLNDIG